MVKQNLVSLLFFISIFSLSLASAQPSFLENPSTSKGLTIFYPQFETVKQNSNFTLHIHVSNISNGVQFTNTAVDCRLHLYDVTGNHTFESGVLTKDSNTYDHEVWISSGNFSTIGTHGFYIFCNNSYLGGEAKGVFDVTYSGVKITSGESNLYIIFFGLFLLLFFLDLWFMAKLPSEEAKTEEELLSFNWLKYLRSVFAFTAWMLVVAIFFISSNIAFSFLQEQLMARVLFMVYQVMFSLTFPIIILWFLWILTSIFRDKKIKHMIEKGIFPNKF